MFADVKPPLPQYKFSAGSWDTASAPTAREESTNAMEARIYARKRARTEMGVKRTAQLTTHGSARAQLKPIG